MVAAEGASHTSRPRWGARGFNGAAAWWPRKAVEAGRVLHVWVLLQWGRGLVAAEGWGSLASYLALVAASMGPRLGGRGRGQAGGARVAAADASMGPRLGGRGRLVGRGPFRAAIVRFNGAAAWWPRKDRSAPGLELRPMRFNGAAAWWPRKAVRSAATREKSQPLQWGRGLVAAEGIREPAELRLLVQLQWGRGLVAAEGARSSVAGSPCP